MSGWTTVTVDATDEQSAEKLREVFNNTADDEHDGARGGDGKRVRAIMWGYDSGDTMWVLKNNPDLWDTAVVMDCNDTTDAGSGTAYESNGTSVESIDSASGVEGARGRDAAHELERHVSGNVYMR